MPADELTTRFADRVVRLALAGGLFCLAGCASGLRSTFEGELAQSSPRGIPPATGDTPGVGATALPAVIIPPTTSFTATTTAPHDSAPGRGVRSSNNRGEVFRRPVTGPQSAAPQVPPSPDAQRFRPVQHLHSARPGRPPSLGNTSPGNMAPGRSRYGRPIVIPQIYPNISAGPTYGYGPPPASLSGQIEIVPLGPTRSRATFQIVPADPDPQAGSVVDTLPPPAPRARYFELPPPPESSGRGAGSL